MATLTKQAILLAFLELAAEKPVDKITVKEIADYCQISRNTFYYHYQDVYQVLEEFLDAESQRVLIQIEKDMDSRNMEEYYLRNLNYIISHRALFYHLNQSSRSEVKIYLKKVGTAIFDHLVEVMSDGLTVSEEDKRMISRFNQYAVQGFIMEWLEGGEDQPIERTLHKLQVVLGENMMEALERSARQ